MELALTARLGRRWTTRACPPRDADRAPADLAHETVTGAAVVVD